MPNFVEIYSKTISLRKFEMPLKIDIFMSICRGGTKVCVHCLNFQYNNFSYVFFVVKKSLYVNLSIPPCGIFIFFKCSTSHVGIRFCRHVPNSTKNKNLKSLNPYLLQKMVLLVSKIFLSPSNPKSNSLIV